VLTADLVTARRRGDELRLSPSDDARRARVAALAGALTARAREEIGRTRDDVEEALRETAAALETGAQLGDRRLAAAVSKLVRDGLEFEETSAAAAADLRRELFRRAAAARRTDGPFDRAALLGALAAERGTTPETLEAALYADRPGAQRLRTVQVPAPALLAARFEIAEAQAVLLRAEKVVAEVAARDARLWRHLFRTLKFLRLLPVITRVKEAKTTRYRVEMDGPLSLFQGAGRYGLQLALALPAIAACDTWSIEADVRWGADRRPLRFRTGGAGVADSAPADDGPASGWPDELATFVAAFERAETGWRIEREPAVLDLPGAGLCVPDLAFVRARDGSRVFFELLGFWSREAVFRRIDLVRAGLPDKILFAASKSLRVGEGLLDDAQGAALYVFSRVLAVRPVLAHLERLAGGTAS
jgi:predicted nuclease of restriction endonuclease-like RecB superfamily